MEDKSAFFRLNIKLTFFSLIFLAIGTFTSIVRSAGSHILIVLPCIYFTYLQFKNNHFPQLTKSQWALLGIVLSIILSILFNYREMDRPLRMMSKVKYFLLPLLGFFAYQEAFSVGFCAFKNPISHHGI